MKELSEYRVSLVNKLVAVANEFATACLAAKDEFSPLTEDGWNIHQLAVHVRDVNHLVYGERARRTAVEEDPEFQDFDGETYMAEHYSADEPLSNIAADLRGQIDALAGMLRTLPPDAWSRTSRHAKLGHGFTLQSWVERDLAHIEEHLQTVRGH